MPDQNQPADQSQNPSSTTGSTNADSVFTPTNSTSTPSSPGGVSTTPYGFPEETTSSPFSTTTTTEPLTTPGDTPPVITPSSPKKGKGKMVAAILGVLVLIGGLAAGLILVRQQQKLEEQAAGPNAKCVNEHGAGDGSCNCNDASGGSCSKGPENVVKYTCDGGGINECRSNESAFSSSHSTDGVGCGKTVQIDAFTKKCRSADGGWICTDADLLDYMVWYSGDCEGPPPPPPPPPAEGTILGRIWLDGEITKCQGCSYGQTQCDSQEAFDRTITITGTSGGPFKVDQCNGTGPLYSEQTSVGSHTVTVSQQTGDSVTWSCYSATAGNCPAQSGSGNTVTVNVSSGELDHVHFYFTTPAPPPPPPPPGASCTVSLTPASVVLPNGGQTTFTAAVTATNGTVSSVNFTSSNTAVATVTPASDTSSPYQTTARVIADAGRSTVTANVIMGGVTKCTDSSGIIVEAPPPPPPPPPGEGPQCLNVKAYDVNWNPLTPAALAALKVGDKVRFTISGSPANEFTKAIFVINGAQSPEVTSKKPGTDEFFYEYTIPAGTTSFAINAHIYHNSGVWIPDLP